EILRYIYRLADEYDIKAIEIRFENRIAGELFTAMPVTMNLEGNYQDLRRFLRRLRDGDRVFRVNSVSLSRAGGTGTDLRATINANTFYNHLEE
ncbi:MAG: type 4a pilus biogenesis protein PilO, partial [Dethiobacteria bacterium]|nr:type 4a pilus biogenesis protein PilO [Dethiobacteria bacterium]